MEQTSEVDAVRKSTRITLAVFVFLILLTIETYFVSQSGLDPRARMILALTVAAIQGFLIAGFLMHLFEERVALHAFVGLTAFLLVTMFSLTWYTMNDKTEGSVVWKGPAIVGEAAPEDGAVATEDH